MSGIAERKQKQRSAEAVPGRSKSDVGVLSSYYKYSTVITICQIYKKLISSFLVRRQVNGGLITIAWMLWLSTKKHVQANRAFIIRNEHSCFYTRVSVQPPASLCSSQFQYALNRRCGEEVRAQFLILHLLCEPLHNRTSSHKRLVCLLHLSTGCIHFSECYLNLP